MAIAKLKPALSEEEIKRCNATEAKKNYNILARDYNRIVDGECYYCHQCDTFQTPNNFYSDKRFASGLFPICKSCMQEQACDYDKLTKTYVDNKEKTMLAFQKMDLPFIDSLYERVKKNNEGSDDKSKQTAYSAVIAMIKSLPQYKDLRWKDSELPQDILQKREEERAAESEILAQAMKRFGSGYSNQDLVFLENEYQDWIARYACENKAQELLFKRICFKELEIEKAQRLNKDTKELDKTLQDLMGSMSLKPNQNNSNALTESKTFGQLIQKWEDEKPIPEPEDEFKDVDKIGLYIDVFFKGHLSKMMGLKNGFSSIYDKFIRKYTVSKPEYDEDADSEELFNKIFGSRVDEL